MLIQVFSGEICSTDITSSSVSSLLDDLLFQLNAPAAAGCGGGGSAVVVSPSQPGAPAAT